MGRYRASNAEKFCEKSNESNESNAITEGHKFDSQLGVLPLTGQTQTGLSVPPMREGDGESRGQEMEPQIDSNVEKLCEKSNEPNPAPPSKEYLFNSATLDTSASLRREPNATTEGLNWVNVGGGP
jgi:hypothetical protein